MTSESSKRIEPFREALRARDAADQRRHPETFTPVPATPYVLDREGRRFLSFSSNDYLGLATDPDAVTAATRALRTHGVGAGASRLVAGTLALHTSLEEELARFTDRAGSVLFNSGFQANSTVIPAVTRSGGLIVSDERVHSSLIQGCRLSRSRVRPFRHNDMDHLEALLHEHGSKSRKTTLIVTESLFSMDGDRAPLDRIAELAERYEALLMVDDAHAFGVLGRGGRGLAAEHDRVDLLVGTFGKALGAAGAFVACNRTLRDHLVNFCTGFVYSTAPPPPTIGAVHHNLGRIRSGEVDLEAFATFVRAAHGRLRAAGFDTSPSDSQIVPIHLGTESAALRCAAFLRDRGILTVAIRPPTVPEGAARIRVSLNRRHTTRHLERLISALEAWSSHGADTQPDPPTSRKPGAMEGDHGGSASRSGGRAAPARGPGA